MTRIDHNVTRGATISISVDGQVLTACAGETLATALLAARVDSFYRTQRGTPRLPFCNMGSCFECRVLVQNEEREYWQLACMTPVTDGMQVHTGLTAGDTLAEAFRDS